MLGIKYLHETLSISFDKNKCNGCGMCVKVCPHAVFAIKGAKAEMIQRNNCMECGACKLNCAQNAINLSTGNGCGCATGIIDGYFGLATECGSDGKSNCC